MWLNSLGNSEICGAKNVSKMQFWLFTEKSFNHTKFTKYSPRLNFVTRIHEYDIFLNFQRRHYKTDLFLDIFFSNIIEAEKVSDFRSFQNEDKSWQKVKFILDKKWAPKILSQSINLHIVLKMRSPIFANLKMSNQWTTNLVSHLAVYVAIWGLERF